MRCPVCQRTHTSITVQSRWILLTEPKRGGVPQTPGLIPQRKALHLGPGTLNPGPLFTIHFRSSALPLGAHPVPWKTQREKERLGNYNTWMVSSNQTWAVIYVKHPHDPHCDDWVIQTSAFTISDSATPLARLPNQTRCMQKNTGFYLQVKDTKTTVRQ